MSKFHTFIRLATPSCFWWITQQIFQAEKFKYIWKPHPNWKETPSGDAAIISLDEINVKQEWRIKIVDPN